MRDDEPFMTFARAIAGRDQARVSGLLAAAPELACGRVAVGATRRAAEEYYLDATDHYVYRGDTAMHVAAAAHQASLVRDLVSAGASVAAANRRGARPLHYAVDGTPGSARWDPVTQRDTVICLVELGADPDAVDRNGTSPLHRAVRNRCAAAVEALLDLGADPHLPNGSGSTPIQLAHWTTGRGGSGSAHATAQREEIIGLLSDKRSAADAVVRAEARRDIPIAWTRPFGRLRV
jgi:ankyrin repeat protein